MGARLARKIKSKRSARPKSFPKSKSKGKTVATYRKNELVFRRGDRADSVYLIRSGRLRAAVGAPEGKGIVVALLGEGDFFGESCLCGQEKRSANVMALTDSAVVRFDKADAARMLARDPVLLKKFLKHLLSRNRRLEEDLARYLSV